MDKTDKLRGLLAEIVDLVRRAQSVDVLDLDATTTDAIAIHFAPVARALLDGALASIERVLIHYERPSIVPPPLANHVAPNERAFDFELDTFVQQQKPSRSRVADLASMAALELRQKRAALPILELVVDRLKAQIFLESLLRRIRKSLTALATSLSVAEGLLCELDFASELETSLRIRRSYVALRAAVDDHHEPSHSQMRPRLQLAGTRMAMILADPDLRIADRVYLRGLRDRMLAALRNPEGAPGANVEALRLWQDLAGFVRQVLSLVSQRQELLQHDGETMELAWTALCDPALVELPASIAISLEALRGLDDEIDSLLSRSVLGVAPWRDALARLRWRIASRTGASSEDVLGWRELA